MSVKFKVYRDRGKWRTFELHTPGTLSVSWFGDLMFDTWDLAMEYANWAAREARGLNGPPPVQYCRYKDSTDPRWMPRSRRGSDV